MVAPVTALPDAEVYLIRPGKDFKWFEAFQEDSFVGLGSPRLADLSGLDKEQIAEEARANHPKKSQPFHSNVTWRMDYFVNQIRVGDIIVTPAPDRNHVAYGLITGDYRYDTEGLVGEVHHWRPVQWVGTASIDDLPESARRTMGSPLSLYRLDAQEEFREWVGGAEGTAKVSPSGSPTASRFDDLADRLLLDASFLDTAWALLEDRRQVVFYGPPGTGKTYVARELAREIAGADAVTLVQFHPSYAYEDFVEGYRPDPKTGGFRLVDGPLKEAATRARESEGPHFLIVDEINRGNVAKVFGELYFLLEYRDEKIRLQYSSEPFDLPDNLYLIGTMNTADRSIALIDAALRRRFHFVGFFPQEGTAIGKVLRRWLERHKPELSWIADAVAQANTHLDRHGAIGPSHFMKENLDEAKTQLIWDHSIIPYIEEVFFGDEERVEEFRLEHLRRSSSEGEL